MTGSARFRSGNVFFKLESTSRDPPSLFSNSLPDWLDSCLEPNFVDRCQNNTAHLSQTRGCLEKMWLACSLASPGRFFFFLPCLSHCCLLVDCPKKKKKKKLVRQHLRLRWILAFFGLKISALCSNYRNHPSKVRSIQQDNNWFIFLWIMKLKKCFILMFVLSLQQLHSLPLFKDEFICGIYITVTIFSQWKYREKITINKSLITQFNTLEHLFGELLRFARKWNETKFRTSSWWSLLISGWLEGQPKGDQMSSFRGSKRHPGYLFFNMA